MPNCGPIRKSQDVTQRVDANEAGIGSVSTGVSIDPLLIMGSRHPGIAGSPGVGNGSHGRPSQVGTIESIVNVRREVQYGRRVTRHPARGRRVRRIDDLDFVGIQFDDIEAVCLNV